MITYRFSRQQNDDFWKTLRTRVNQHFTANNIDKDANSKMVLKSVVLFTIYLSPFFLLIFGGFTNYWLLMSLWVVMGLGKAFIGTAVMHDALHGSYFKNKTLNSLMSISATLVGVDSLIWKIQHNVIHHTYTNIEDTDEDILPRIVFRFSKHQPKYWFHRFQHIYAPIFYCVPLLEWITTKDFIKAFEYKGLKLIASKEFIKEFAGIFFRKAIYYAIFLVLPVMVIDAPFWSTITMIIVSHAVTGIMLAMIFQTAHVVPNTDFVKPEGDELEKSWASHQLYTTSNYGMNNKVLTWFVGGLNYQVEHHLFPDVCHVHYPAISKIVKETTKEYELPYLSFPTFGAAVAGHFSLLKNMGK
ncbi:MAG: acyl-CoA desaturase [Reichenbachiella sp.]